MIKLKYHDICYLTGRLPFDANVYHPQLKADFKIEPDVSKRAM